MKKMREFFLDMLSFNTPQAICLNLILIFAFLAVVPTEYLSVIPLRCVFKTFIIPAAFGIFGQACPATGFFADCECSACGMTRGMSRLLHGDVAGALDFNRGVIVLFAVMLAVLVVNAVKAYRHYKSTGRIL